MKKVDVALFSYRHHPTNPMLACQRAFAEARKLVHLRVWIYGNALIHRARNEAIAQLPEDSDAMVFLDDDTVPEPEGIIKLLAHERPVVSAWMTTRQPPIRPVSKLYDPKTDQWIPPPGPPPPNTIMTGEFSTGPAFLLVDRPTIEALKEYYLSARDWLEENRRTMDRLHVRAELREKERARREEIRRGFWQREKVLRIWDYPVGENELQLGEDVGLARKLQKLKIPVAIDTGINVHHMGEYAYGPEDVDWEELAKEAAA